MEPRAVRFTIQAGALVAMLFLYLPLLVIGLNAFGASKIPTWRFDAPEAGVPLVEEDSDAARAVQQRGIGNTVAVHVGPAEAAQPVDTGEGLDHLPGAVCIIAQHGWRAGGGAEDDVQVAVQGHVRRPGAGVAAVEDGGREAGIGGLDAESSS